MSTATPRAERALHLTWASLDAANQGLEGPVLLLRRAPEAALTTPHLVGRDAARPYRRRNASRALRAHAKRPAEGSAALAIPARRHSGWIASAASLADSRSCRGRIRWNREGLASGPGRRRTRTHEKELLAIARGEID